MNAPGDPAALADAPAREAALDLGRHVLAVAPAGSGKTGLLVQRLLAALATVAEPEQVVAITFTNKAAAEIRTRVLDALQRAAAGRTPPDAHGAREFALASAALRHARERGWDLAANPERLRALTIDGLQAQIAAELPLLSGLGGRVRVVEDASALYEEALLALFAQIEEPDAPEDLRAAAALWLRGAGNRVDRLLPAFANLLARREQWRRELKSDFDWSAHERKVLTALHVEHQQRLAQALGERDSAELVALVCEGSAAHELLAWAAELRRWPACGAEHAWLHRKLAQLLVTRDGGLRKKIDSTVGFAPRHSATARMKKLVTDRADDAALANAAADLLALPPIDVCADLARLRDALLVLLRQALAHLKVLMGERGEADFSEIAEAAVNALRPAMDGGGHAYGDALLRRDAQLRHLLVDEMQDTSESQLELLRHLIAGWQPGDGRSLFLVGDPQQSIYAFRKAEVRLFLKLLRERRLDHIELDCVHLSSNFRSDAAVVDWFNATFAAIFPARVDELAGAVPYVASRAALPRTAAAGVNLHRFAAGDGRYEARAAAARAAALARDDASVAILVRARSHVADVLRELRRLGVRAACTEVDPLAAVPAVRDLLAAARALWHPEDRLLWAVLLRAPFVCLSWADLVALSLGRRDAPWPQRIAAADAAPLSDEGRSRLARLREALTADRAAIARGATLAERVEGLWSALGGPACVDAAELGDARHTLRLLREHARGGGLADARGFARAVARLYAAPSKGAVQVMTVHKAKGLEFDHVLLVGCARAPGSDDKPLLHLARTAHGSLLVPKPPEHWDEARAEAASALYKYVHGLQQRARRNENFRLLYVAATRARRSLDLYLCADDDDKGALKAPATSFAGLLRPALSALPPPAIDDAAVPPQPKPGPPRAPRLRLPFAPPREERLYRPREQRALRPSEAVLSAHENKRVEEAQDDIYAQLVGTLLHQALEKIAHDGVEAWGDGGASRAAALAAGFRRLGLPEPQVASAVQRVLTLLARVLGSTTGRWLLGSHSPPHSWAASEYALAGWREGRWVSALLDRCFETAEGELWVVDYKAAARPVAAAGIDAYIREAVARYRPQLALYAELLAAQRPGKPVRAALYFVEADRLVQP